MYRPNGIVRVMAAAAVVTLAAISVTAVAEAGGTGGGAGAAASAGSGHHAAIHRFNEANTHSPQVERMLSAGTAHPPGVRATAVTGPAPGGTATIASTVQGIDVASIQHDSGSINWGQVYSGGYKFAFIKATEGSYYANPYYGSDAAAAKGAGLIVAPYAFAIPNYTGGALQADYALDYSGYAADSHTLPLIIDLEYDPYDQPVTNGGDGTNECYGLTPAQMVTWISAFAAETLRRTGQSPAIYTTAAWWKTCTGDSTVFASDPLWIASFSTSPPMPSVWSGWTYWQYSDTATVSGISGKTDVSYLSTSALELAKPAAQSYQPGAVVSTTASSLDGGQAVGYTAGGLPGGLSIGPSVSPSPSAGVISGTLTGTPATFRSSITATATGAPAASASFPWYVHGPVSIGSVSPATGSVGTPVGLTVPAADSLPGCTLAYAATGLPPGLSISSCGRISGWPSASGHYQVSVQVTDSSGSTLATRSFSWSITGGSGKGPTGQITLYRDGKCLQELRAADIAIEKCGSAAAQRWTVAANGSIRINNRCLAASSSALSVTACNNGGQRWQLGSGGSLTDLSNSRCLSDAGSANGSRATAAACYVTYNNTGSVSTPGANQRWTLPAGPLTAGIAGSCASDWHRAGTKFGPVTLRGCKATPQQNWTIEPDGTVRAGGDCLSLNRGHTSYGTTVRLAGCNRSATQSWQLAGGPIGVQLVSPVAGLCLADPGGRSRAGTQLALGGCLAGDPGVWWRVS
jgi:GH25 family lysozyme M1 (1,4-beta-N-acetylmuramidase)